MTFTRAEWCADESVHDSDGDIRLGSSSGEADDICVVMISADASRSGIVNQRGLDSRVAIGRDAHADSCRANENASSSVAIKNLLTNRFSEVGIIHRVLVVRAEITKNPGLE